MDDIEIPEFVGSMGHRIIGYILNLDDESAKGVLDGSIDLDHRRREVLRNFIELCRNLRYRALDREYIDMHFFALLTLQFKDGRHLFNTWREQLGGTRLLPDNPDQTVLHLSRLGLEIYPLFLIKLSVNSPVNFPGYSHVSPSLFSHVEYGTLLQGLMNDEGLWRLFSGAREAASDAVVHYMASSGRGGTLQFLLLPWTIISNAYELMRLRGELAQASFVKAIEEITNTIRAVAQGEIVQVPLFMGFHNVGVKNLETLETAWGTIRPYHEGLFELIPTEAQPSTFDGENLGFVIESKYPYRVEFRDHETGDWPAEYDEVRGRLSKMKEDLTLSFALAVVRDPPVGIMHTWTLLADPMSSGTNVSWNGGYAGPMPHHVLESHERESVGQWLSITRQAKDDKIRIAVRQIVSAISLRDDPQDGFVDTMIALENLFGGPSELSYRISVAVACLLEDDEGRRSEMQRKLVGLYRDRSKIVHGEKEIPRLEVAAMRNECLDVALRCLRTLYASRTELLADGERARKLALE